MALVNFRAGAWDPLMKEAGLTTTVTRAGKDVEVPKYTSLRAAPLLRVEAIETGRDLKFIQTAMGHSKIEVTFNVYGHLIRGREEQHRQSAEDLAFLLLPAKARGKSVACNTEVFENA